MALTWPSILPQRTLEDSFRAAMPEGRLRAQPEGGPMRMRRRSVAASQPISIDMMMQQYQMARLDKFWNVTTKGGVLPFEITDPFNEENTLLVTFGDDEIAWTALAADVWRATFSIAVLRDA